MDAVDRPTPAIDAASRAAPPPVAAWSFAALTCLMVAVAALLVWRRLGGALVAPLGAWTLLATGVTIAAFGVVAGRLGSAIQPVDPRALGAPRLCRMALFAPIAATAAALSLPGTSAAGLIALWAPVVLGMLSALRAEPWRSVPLSRARLAERAAHRLRVFAPETAPAPSAAAAPPAATAAPGDEVLQQCTRSQTAGGGELLSAWLRMPFAAGQRSGSLHVAFCPPFEHAPELSFEQVSGPAARIKAAQVMPYGARLDVKLPTSASESAGNVLIRVTARCEG